MTIQILMIIPVDTVDPAHQQDVIQRAHAHYNNFKQWNNVDISVFGPTDNYYIDPITYIDHNLGLPRKTPILNHIQGMQEADRIIYIDDHSAIVNGLWKLDDLVTNPQYVLPHDEFDEALGGNRAHLICRGGGSGEVVTNPSIAKPNRNIFCSMHDDQDLYPSVDQYMLTGAADLSQLDIEHENEAQRLVPTQQPQKFLGI